MERSPIICIQEVRRNYGNQQRLHSTIVSNNINHFWVDTIRLNGDIKFETLVFYLSSVEFDRDREIIEPGHSGAEVIQFGRYYESETDSIGGHVEIVEEVASWIENNGHLKTDL